MVWNLSFKSWLKRAGSIAGRNFSDEEWSKFLPDEEYRPTFPQGLLMQAHQAALQGNSQAAERAYRDLAQLVSQSKSAELTSGRSSGNPRWLCAGSGSRLRERRCDRIPKTAWHTAMCAVWRGL